MSATQPILQVDSLAKSFSARSMLNPLNVRRIPAVDGRRAQRPDAEHAAADGGDPCVLLSRIWQGFPAGSRACSRSAGRGQVRLQVVDLGH